MILSFYDPIEYLPYTISKNAESVLIADIFKNVKASFDKVAKNYNLVGYNISGAPRPEALAYELYDNPQYYWVLLMANNIYDPFHGWIKTQQACYDYADQKYENAENTVLYHIDETRTKRYNLEEYPENSGNWYDKGDLARKYLQHKGSLAAISAYEHEILENEKKRNIRIIPPGQMNQFMQDLIQELGNASRS